VYYFCNYLVNRFDFEEAEEGWIYRRTGQSLHQLLDEEMKDVLNLKDPEFHRCYLGGKTEGRQK